MKKLKAVILGYGGRGSIYGDYAADLHPEALEIVAIADPNEKRQNFAAEKHKADNPIIYNDWKEIAAQPKMADFAVIATQDAMHLEQALAMIEKGYHLLLEKLGLSTLRGNFRFTSVADMAALASVVFAAYRLGDPTAAAIIRSEAEDLSRMILAAAKEGDRIVACGSILAQFGDVLFPILETILKGYVQIVIPPLPPVYGAAVECIRRMQLPIPDGFQETFAETYLRLSAERSEERPLFPMSLS